VFVAEERGLHTRSIEEFLPQNHGINTQSREFTRDMLQEQNVAPRKVLRQLRELGVAEKDLPTRDQLNTFKMRMKTDRSDSSKYRLQNLHELKEHFTKYTLSSKEQYESLGKQPMSSLICFKMYQTY
jgi:hypothetical protein